MTGELRLEIDGDVTQLPMFTNPELYDLVYCGSERGDVKYDLETNFIYELAAQLGLERRILDVGCGTGTHLAKLLKRGFVGEGVDLNSLMLGRARQKTRGLPVEFHQGDMQTFDLRKKFPIVSSLYGAMHYLPSEESAKRTIANFYNHLEEGGLLVADIKWGKFIPDDVTEEVRGDGITIVREWKRDSSDPTGRTAFYKAAIFRTEKQGFLTYEVHHPRIMDPFWAGEAMKDTGFVDVKIYDNFNLEKQVQPSDEVYRTVVTARKPRS